MDAAWLAYPLVAAATIVAVALCVLGHYEGLSIVSRWLAKSRSPERRKVLLGISSVLALHVAEIWTFGVTVWLLMLWPACGDVSGDHSLTLFDAIYFSAITFTTVGFGDLTPVGPVRVLIGTEALTGFVLITWSASFTFLEMQRFWKDR